MDPLKVTFELGTPMVPSAYPIHLDALVAYAITAKALAAGGDLDGVQKVRSLADALPFASETRDGKKVWQASALIQESVSVSGIRMWTRKTDPYDYAARMANGDIKSRTKMDEMKPYALKIDTQRGILKNAFQFYPVKMVNKAVAWCIGDIDELENLLQPESGWLTHIGARGRVGHGLVQRVTIEPDPLAQQNWKLRVLPWQESDEYYPIQAAFQPPYWAAENRTQAYCHGNLLG